MSDAGAARLDLSRSPNRHITFGVGARHCLGSQLARLELQVAPGTLVRRLDAIDLAADSVWKANVRTRGLEHLPIRSRAA